jgi:hypothetical protein
VLRRLTGVFMGVGGAVVWNDVGICKDVAMLYMWWTYCVGPTDVGL